MKKLCIFLLTVLLFTGCQSTQSAVDDPLTLYYPKIYDENTPSELVIQPIQHETAADLSVSALVELYLKGPEDPTLYSCYPKGTQLLNIEDNGKLLIITLSNECASMSPLNITLSGSCLAKTLFPYTEAEKITIQAKDGFTNISEPPVFDRNNIAVSDINRQSAS